jgi:hypothetical protein
MAEAVGEDKIELSQELLEELRDDLGSLLHQWSPHRDRADYICAFCGESPRTNNSDINHLDTCLGRKLERALWQ